MKKKICLFSGDITRNGGTERVVTRLADALILDNSYEICILSLTEQADEPFYKINSSIPRYKLGDRWISPGPGYLPVIKKLRKFIKENRIDIIVDVDIVLDVLSIPAVRRLKTKVISWEHFTADFELSVFYRRLILKYSVKRSDYVVVLTDGDLMSYHERLKRTKSICRIYNPIEMPPKGLDSERKKQIVTVGRLVPPKGIDMLMPIAKKVLADNPDWQWLLLGEGEEREKLEKFIEANGLHNRLILAGNVKDVDMYLRESAIYVCTSKYEGLGMSLLEACRMGVPCISFAVKEGPIEIIKDGENGYLVQPFDCDQMAAKISEMICDPILRDRFAKNALASLDRFDTETVVGQWKNLFDKL